VLTNLGAVFNDLGQYEESLKYSRLALAISPDDPAILENIGKASYNVGDLEAATESLSRAVRLNPGDAELARILAWCYRAKGNPTQAIATLSAVRGSKNPEVFLDLAIALEEQGRHEEGSQAAAQAAESFRLAGQPDREAAAYCQLGWSTYKLDDFPRSVAASRKAVELDPTLFAAQFNLGLALLLMGDQDGARRHYEAGMNAVREPSDIKFYAIGDLKAAARVRGEVPGLQPIVEALQAKHAALSEALTEGPNKAPPVSK
jgi:tetratricopeptide (TPR) repeat protein